ncbi:hypothetical protein EB796_000054 [Bugula neritina]|uniref:FJX1 n=1 Tax=Bugula neritina TaxID=10212 RepID=A0A7J7J366_BUGNE|nr:hypothetical protein EB796_021048 [Bugula neritina]KAF6041635.1 hypothetical protein EB796_000054 [Bugula neritina]
MSLIHIVITVYTSLLCVMMEVKVTGAYVDSKVSPSVYINSSSEPISADEGQWAGHVAQLVAVKVQTGCGRMQNRLVTFEDGTKACARYRVNSNLMQGEIYSYFLAQLLGIKNLPPLALALPDINTRQWSRVADAVLQSQWQADKLIILTKYISNINEVVLPQKLKGLLKEGVTPKDLTQNNMELYAQWSDLIIFDYIIGNMDRLVNSLHNQQWNSEIMDMPVHNLARKDNSLLFLDNEDGLFHGYRIMNRYSQYHEQSLHTVCVFRASTVSHIERLLQANDLGQMLIDVVQKHEPKTLKYLPRISNKTMDTLTQRISNVMEHIRKCEQQYSS